MRCFLTLYLCLCRLPAEALTGNTQLLRYLRCENAYYLVAIDDSRVDLVPLGSVKSIDSLVNEYVQSIHLLAADRHTGHRLYRALFPGSFRLTSRLVICADGTLGRFPFECLVSDTLGCQPVYLVQQASILYTENLQAYFTGARVSGPASRRLLALAPDLEPVGMSPLPFAGREVSDAVSIYPGLGQLAKNLSKTDFLELAPRYDILHLATHARADDRNPGRSCFFLNAAGKADTIFADELRGLNLRAQLLILSACESANGLAQAFREAGARNVLAATWKLPDKCSARIIRYFYQHLRRGCEKSRALQLAKLDYLASADALGAEPGCWAGLLLYGDAYPLSWQAASPKQALLLDSLVCLLAAISFYLVKKYIPARRCDPG